MVKVAIVEIGGSHDECVLSQVIALKNAGCFVVFCGTKDMWERNMLFSNYFDEFHEVNLPHSMFGDLFCMRKLNKWFVKNGISKVVANTAQGGHIRNLCLTSNRKVKFFGIIHTIKMLQGSFTQSIISRKIKHYFLLNKELIHLAGPQKGIDLHAFYPLDYPKYALEIYKPVNEIWITIIGGVENRRKDLSGFIAFAKNTAPNVKFIFLGRSDENNQDVIQFKAKIEEENCMDKIVLFESFIQQDVFDAYLKKTDGIMPLVHPNTASAQEYFSRQISGAINVAFSYNIPMMIHQAYVNWDDFATGVQFYTSNDMNDKFVLFIQKIQEQSLSFDLEDKFSKIRHQQNFAGVVLNS